MESNGKRVDTGVNAIVFADDSGVCFIPRERAAEVLALAQKKVSAEARKCKAIDDGVPVSDLPKNA